MWWQKWPFSPHPAICPLQNHNQPPPAWPELLPSMWGGYLYPEREGSILLVQKRGLGPSSLTCLPESSPPQASVPSVSPATPLWERAEEYDQAYSEPWQICWPDSDRTSHYFNLQGPRECRHTWGLWLYRMVGFSSNIWHLSVGSKVTSSTACQQTPANNIAMTGLISFSLCKVERKMVRDPHS